MRITTRAEYDAQVAEGFEPLINVRRFEVEHGLRVELQREKFGTGHTPRENEKFYRWVWRVKPHICEECAKPLNSYSAVHISHILTRGAHPDMAHDPRNVNILCLGCHGRWENGNREGMRIYQKNLITITKLKQEYEIQRPFCE